MAQQSLDIEDNVEEKQEKLSQDNSRPFSPPSGTRDAIPKDHPALDDINSSQEWYDEGREGEAEVHDSGNRGVAAYRPMGYTPPQNGLVKTIKKSK